jgi:hypothetical protein
MKNRVLIATLPTLAVGGIILLFGLGAQSQKTDQAGSVASANAVAAAPTEADAAGAAIEPLPRIATAPAKLSPGVDEIVRLAQAGVGDEVLQAYIENSSVAYKLDVDEILYLHDLGLSAEMISTMVRHGQSLASQPAPLAAVPSPDANAIAQPAATEAAATAPPADTNPVPVDDAAVVTPPPQVNNNYFYQTLSPYGTWVEVAGYGWCWQPTVAVVDTGWRPYCNSGHWVWTDCGWYWQSDYSWGWAPFHYGRWYRSSLHGWVWAPDSTWAPAWVTWRYSDTYCGWAPLPPGAYFDVGVGFRFHGGRVGVGFDFGLVPDCFTFIPTRLFCDLRPWRHCLPGIQVVNIFNRTRIINNYGAGPRGGIIANLGPGRNAIATVTRTEIRKVELRDANPAGGIVIKADRLDRDGRTLAVFRPKLPQQASAPPTQIVQRQQELRKSGEILARSEGIKPAGAGVARGTSIVPSTVRGTPSPQITRPAPNAPAISRNTRSEGRSPGVTQPSLIVGRQPQAQPAPRPLAEALPRTSEPTPNVGDRSRVYQPQQNAQPLRRDSTVPAGRPQPAFPARSYPQVTPPLTYTPPAVSRPAPPAPAYNLPPRVQESRSSSPGYQPPRSYSPPPASSRSYTAPAPRPSSPPPSYSAPPRSQSAPSSAPSRDDGGRKR